MNSRPLKIGTVTLGGKQPAFILGPCVIESEKFVWRMARRIAEVCAAESVPFIFKASYDKANRTSVRSFRGLQFCLTNCFSSAKSCFRATRPLDASPRSARGRRIGTAPGKTSAHMHGPTPFPLFPAPSNSNVTLVSKPLGSEETLISIVVLRRSESYSEDISSSVAACGPRVMPTSKAAKINAKRVMMSKSYGPETNRQSTRPTPELIHPACG